MQWFSRSAVDTRSSRHWFVSAQGPEEDQILSVPLHKYQKYRKEPLKAAQPRILTLSVARYATITHSRGV